MATETQVILALQRLKEILRTSPISLSDEHQAQNDIEQILVDFKIQYHREYQLNISLDRPDFYLPNSGLILEVKVAKAWSKIQVFRQCERYCSDERVKGLLLATGQAQGLPSRIMDKPAQVFQLAQGRL